MKTFTRDWLEQSVDEIDAAVFSGDAFLEEQNREALREYMARWERELQNFEALAAANEAADTKEE